MEEKYPSLGVRIQSAFIDTILIIILMIIFTNILDNFKNVPDWVRIIMFLVVFIAYEPFCMTMGCTLGNYLKGIRIRKAIDPTQKISLLQAIIRYPIKLFLGWISFLTITSNPKRQAIHDLASGTLMIKL